MTMITIKTFALPLTILAANASLFADPVVAAPVAVEPAAVEPAAVEPAAPAPAQGPLSITSTAMVETKTPAPDGTTRVSLTPARRVVPGDRVTFVVTYRNTGNAALSDVAVVNPVPSAVAYNSAANGSPAPEVSVDGRTFAPLASLRVAAPGGPRAATPADITHLRWRLARPLMPGGEGRLAYQATLK